MTTIEDMTDEQVQHFGELGTKLTQDMRELIGKHIKSWGDSIDSESKLRIVMGAPSFCIAELVTMANIPDEVAHELLQLAIDVERNNPTPVTMQ